MEANTKPVFSKAELAARWNCSKQSVENMEKDGILHRLPLPNIRYSAREVHELEGLKESERDPMSPFERRRLMNELAAKNKELAALKARLQRIAMLAAQFMAEEAEKEVKEV